LLELADDVGQPAAALRVVRQHAHHDVEQGCVAAALLPARHHAQYRIKQAHGCLQEVT
jgi:hypothetical protein